MEHWPFAREGVRTTPSPPAHGADGGVNPEALLVDPSDQRYEELKQRWIDKFVRVNADCPELKRFAGIVGRVITVNRNNKAIVDFQDGGWYDISASEEYLTLVDPAEAKGKYDATANSAQPYPSKQG
jgi:hypothetical protein